MLLSLVVFECSYTPPPPLPPPSPSPLLPPWKMKSQLNLMNYESKQQNLLVYPSLSSYALGPSFYLLCLLSPLKGGNLHLCLRASSGAAEALPRAGPTVYGSDSSRTTLTAQDLYILQASLPLQGGIG